MGGVGRAQPHVFLRVCRNDHLEMLWEKVGCWSAHFTGGESTCPKCMAVPAAFWTECSWEGAQSRNPEGARSRDLEGA